MLISFLLYIASAIGGQMMWKVKASLYIVYCLRYRRSNYVEGRSLILFYIASAIGGQMRKKVGASFYRIFSLPHFIARSNDVVGRSFILLNIASFLCILPPPSEVKRRRMEKLYFTVMLPLL